MLQYLSEIKNPPIHYNEWTSDSEKIKISRLKHEYLKELSTFSFVNLYKYV